MESVDEASTDAVEERVAVVKTGGDEGVDECQSQQEGVRIGSDLCNIAKVVEGGFDNLADVRLEGEGGVKDW